MSAERRRVVWKCVLSPAQPIEHEIPPGSRLLDLKAQGDVPVTWWSVPADPPPPPWPVVRFEVFGTGMAYDSKELHYVGSFQIPSAAFVGHVFTRDPFEREVAS